MQPDMTHTQEQQNWDVVSLLKRAYNRMKPRLLSYIFLSVVNVIISIAGVALIGTMIFIAAFLFKSHAPFAPLAAILAGVGITIVTLYVSAWFSLSGAVVFTEPVNTSFDALIRTIRSNLRPYIGVMIPYLLLFLGLLPFGILTLGGLFIVMSVWSSFFAFVFLKDRRQGLDNWWVSKQMASQRFWTILFYYLILNVGIWLLQALIGKLDIPVGLRSTTIWLLSFLSVPFIVCFGYEMYTNLSKPSQVQRPRKWIILAVIGWILPIALAVSAFTIVSSPEFQKIFEELRQTEPKNFKLPPVVKTI